MKLRPIGRHFFALKCDLVSHLRRSTFFFRLSTASRPWLFDDGPADLKSCLVAILHTLDLLSSPSIPAAGVAKLVYAPDSKSGEVKLMSVRVRPPAPDLQAFLNRPALLTAVAPYLDWALEQVLPAWRAPAARYRLGEP